jgi:hypothetical protein
MSRSVEKTRSWLYIGTAFGCGSWVFLVAWFGRDKSCRIDRCFWSYVFLWLGLAFILVATVALLVRSERILFPTKPLALISVSSTGGAILSLIVVGLVAGLEETAETTIGLIILFVLGCPVVFVLASAVWLLFPPRSISQDPDRSSDRSL